MSHDADLVARARGGERAALEELVRASKDLVYNLAVRMLGDPTDADDASQEILIRIVTGLSAFRGESAFRTWVYRVASNHLLTARKRRAEEKGQSFESIAAYLDAGLASDAPPLDEQVLIAEAKLTCTSTMLLCLDRDHRLAYILGEILDLSSDEAAEVLEIAPDAFRKRLSRARERMTDFMHQRCGLVDPALPCRCAKQAGCAVKAGTLSGATLRWAPCPSRERAVGQPRVEDIDRIARAATVFRSHPDYVAPEAIVDGLRRALDTTKSDLLS